MKKSLIIILSIYTCKIKDLIIFYKIFIPIDIHTQGYTNRLIYMSTGIFFDINNKSGFCEKIWGHSLGTDFAGNTIRTQYFNAFSSFAFILYGLIGLFATNTEQSYLILFMYANLTVCGVGSFIYHLTGYWFASLLDGFPMIFMTSMGLLIMLWDFTYEQQQRVEAVDPNSLSYMSPPASPRMRFKRKINHRISAGLCLLLVLYYNITLIVSATYVNYIAFTVMFAFPLAPINGFMIYYYVKSDKIPGNIEERKKLKTICKYSWITGVIGLVMWILDQALCTVWPPIVYFLGHVWWHIGIGYFAMSMITFSSYLLANNFNYKARVLYFWKIFPLVVWY